ncbi:TIGR00366 family protein [Brenneria populi]|uniref:TIGR00366 family protein n=1 Tax=Brenneria populi TaxID=1505588 RepID=A0ABU6JRZ4_9GAMM|nr:TIGR00366 family protein [Brenneria populi Li et al. 2015]
MINRMVMFFVNLMNKYLPDPFTVAWLITLVVVAMAFAFTSATPGEVIGYWGDGFYDLLAFAMQMSLVLVTGYALADAAVIQKAMRALVRIPKTPQQTVFFVSLASAILCYLNWGLCIIAGAFLAREAARAHPDVDIRLIVAAGFSGIIVTHGGLSASIPLLINTQGHFLQQEIGLIPLEQTIFAPQALVITILLLICIPFCCLLMMPKKGQEVLVDPSVFDDAPSGLEVKTSDKPTFIADRLEQSKILKYLLGFSGLGYLAYTWATKGLVFNLNILIFLFLVLGILAHGTLLDYARSITRGATTCGGIILQYPFYAGIMGIMKGSGLVFIISDALLAISNAHTFELMCYLSSMIISIFVPSAGGHWAVQAPFMLPAAQVLEVETWKVAMGVAWGESIWNIVTPFWALPVLAITKTSLRDLIGFTVFLWIVGNIIVIPCILFIGN